VSLKICSFIVVCCLTLAPGFTQGEPDRDIRNLTQHFIDTGEKMDPWMFYPESNIKTLSTTKHRGYLMLEDAGTGEDIKGSPKEPIRIDDYPIPWDFKMGLMQPQPKSGDNQNNYAFGVNVAVTFSDPSTWPEDRTQMPPDTHTLQLLVVRLGAYGEMNRRGVPQLRYNKLNYGDPSPEIYMLYGRGDLAPNVLGDWEIPYIWMGYEPPSFGQLGAASNWSWGKVGGPAESSGLMDVRFNIRVLSPTKMEVGFGFGHYVGWRMRTVDLSRFGKITGIWEIGPVISLDRWMADEFGPSLDIKPMPELDPPNPGAGYYLDYCSFFGSGPESFEHFSEEFNIPGLPADHKWFNEGDGVVETWSNPGYSTVTFPGKYGAWAMCPRLDCVSEAGVAYFEMDQMPPPLEMELAFVAPDDSVPWNVWHSYGFTDTEGKPHGWSPGIQNIPGKGRFYINSHSFDPDVINENPEMNIEFEDEIPQELLTHKPIRMLLQVITTKKIRVGLKGPESDPWLFSKPLEFEWEMARFKLPCPVSYVGLEGSGMGNYPAHHSLLVDYVRYRFGVTEK